MEESLFRAEFLDRVSDAWRAAPSLAVGRRAGRGEPDAYVGVARGGEPHLRIDVHTNLEHECFRDVRCLGSLVAVGYGDHVHFVDARSRESRSVEMDGYFGGLYTPEDLGLRDRPFELLAASASSLLRFGRDGVLVWEARELGIDGVRVDDVEGAVITGSGEWDPPGGWKPFAVELESGREHDSPRPCGSNADESAAGTTGSPPARAGSAPMRASCVFACLAARAGGLRAVVAVGFQPTGFRGDPEVRGSDWD